MTLKLYHHPLSPNGRRVRAVAVHLGLLLEEHVVDVLRGEHRTPEFLARNPNGLVPALDDDGFVLWESNAIIQYLADKKGDGSLWPSDYRARADITRWQFWQSAHFSRPVETITFERLLRGLMHAGAPDVAVIERAEAAFHRVAGVLERHLEGREHLVGGSWTLADFAVGSTLTFAQSAALPLAPFPHIARWYERLSALPAWQATAPEPPA